MRCEICGEGDIANGLPCWLCWDANASPEQVHDWVRRVRINRHDGAHQFLGSIGSAAAADALRGYLHDDEPRILERVVSSLGWSGDASDGPALIPLVDHPDKEVRRRVMEALVELDIAVGGEPLVARLSDPTLAVDERRHLLECLAWLRHPGVLPELRELLKAEGLSPRFGRHGLAASLVLVGDARDRAEMARIAIAHLERSAAEGYVEPRFERTKEWELYKRTVGSVAPDEVALAEAGLSDAARLALTWHPRVFPVSDDDPLGPPVNTRRTIAGFTDRAPADSGHPPAKFLGLPDWRERPSWPVGGDGRLLMFYGQLPLDDGRTAYLFTGGPDEWHALGPGSAIVVQPGGDCHLPTVERVDGPRSFDWVADESPFIRRLRRRPQPDRYVVWSDGADPAEYPANVSASEDHWNKVGGTPLYLQGDDTPGPEWSFALQFGAERAGSERGDGAVFYGWVNDAGQGALGWQCH